MLPGSRPAFWLLLPSIFFLRSLPATLKGYCGQLPTKVLLNPNSILILTLSLNHHSNPNSNPNPSLNYNPDPNSKPNPSPNYNYYSNPNPKPNLNLTLIPTPNKEFSIRERKTVEIELRIFRYQNVSCLGGGRLC
jgi:hypothetical protein